MGLLALRPGDSLTILVDGFVNGLQESQFPSFLLFKLATGLGAFAGRTVYPGGTCERKPTDPHASLRWTHWIRDLARSPISRLLR
jgi:hypothetical protein